MSVPKEFVDGVNRTLGAEAERIADGVGNAYQSFLTGQPIYMADRANEGPEWFTQEAAEQDARTDVGLDEQVPEIAPETDMDRS